MYRIRLLKYLAKKQLTSTAVLLQNECKSNYKFGCMCISNANLNQNLQKPVIQSKKLQNEGADNKLSTNRNLTDKEFFVRLKNDPDRFGLPQEKEVIDEGDIQEEKFFTEQPIPSKKLTTKQYADIIKRLITQHKIKEAIDVVEVRMLKEDRVKPEAYLYNLLLGACGRVGYTKKAFRLYNDMKKRGLKVTGGTYTALFNACSNSPWPTTDGLTRATHLRNIMIEKGYEPNDTNYNAMIKAFGRCGDLPTAFTVVDEMCSKGLKIKDDTINFLLQACISDKDAGFRHALLVWRKVVNKRIRPSVYTYNLMLRCIRDCGLGDLEVTQDVINRIISSSSELVHQGIENSDKKLLSSTIQIGSGSEDTHKQGPRLAVKSPTDVCKPSDKNNENVAIESSISSVSEEKASEKALDLNTLRSTDIKDLRPNLMAPVPHLGSLISLSEIKRPEERLLLVGGCSGFLENMDQNECTPNIKTFTQLLDNIPSTLTSENELMTAIKKYRVKPDIDFFNMLIRKRSVRYDFENARAVLVSMNQYRYRPNLITYGVLALSCKNKEEALELLGEMESKSYRLNIQILGAMLHQACYHRSFSYVLELMEICIRENIQTSKKFMTILDDFMKKCKRLQYSKELTKSEERKFTILKTRYKTWSQEVQVDDTEDIHPWQQYRETNEQDAKYYKWKDGTRFKAQHASLYRVKTSRKHKK